MLHARLNFDCVLTTLDNLKLITIDFTNEPSYYSVKY